MKRFSFFFVASCFFITLCMTALSLYICLVVSEQFFFDRVLYQKSSLHGYWKAGLSPTYHFSQLPYLVRLRLQDVRQLTQSYETHTSFPKKAKYSVVVLGDSYGFGTGVRWHQSFPTLLEQKIKAEFSDVEVYNFSTPADDILDHYAKYELAEEILHPDFYVLGGVVNDLDIQFIDKYPKKRMLFEHLQQKCLGNLPTPPDTRESLDGKIDQYTKEIVYPTFLSENKNLCFLKDFLAAVDASKFVFIPLDYNQEKFETDDPYFFGLYSIRTYIETVQKAGISVINPYITKPELYQPVSTIERHPNASSHAGFAGFIFEYLEPRLRALAAQTAEQPPREIRRFICVSPPVTSPKTTRLKSIVDTTSEVPTITAKPIPNPVPALVSALWGNCQPKYPAQTPSSQM
jgi:hypothetical protein